MFGAKFTQNITILMLKFAEISMSKFSLATFWQNQITETSAIVMH